MSDEWLRSASHNGLVTGSEVQNWVSCSLPLPPGPPRPTLNFNSMTSTFPCSYLSEALGGGLPRIAVASALAPPFEQIAYRLTQVGRQAKDG